MWPKVNFELKIFNSFDHIHFEIFRVMATIPQKPFGILMGFSGPMEPQTAAKHIYNTSIAYHMVLKFTSQALEIKNGQL